MPLTYSLLYTVLMGDGSGPQGLSAPHRCCPHPFPPPALLQAPSPAPLQHYASARGVKNTDPFFSNAGRLVTHHCLLITVILSYK